MYVCVYHIYHLCVYVRMCIYTYKYIHMQARYIYIYVSKVWSCMHACEQGARLQCCGRVLLAELLDWLFYPHCRSIIHRDEDHTKCSRISKVTSKESKLQAGTGHSGKAVFIFHSFKSLTGWQRTHMTLNFTTTFLLFTCLGLWLHPKCVPVQHTSKYIKEGKWCMDTSSCVWCTWLSTTEPRQPQNIIL